jgi:hypothetical protein
MKRMLLAALAIVLCAQMAFAQAGTICLFSDAAGTQCSFSDNGPGIMEVYVVHAYAPAATAVQFAAPKPDCMIGATWVADTSPWPVVIGDSQIGAAVAYNSCLASPVHVLTITYATTGATTANCPYPVLPDPAVANIEVADCGGNVFIGSGGTAYVNSSLSCECVDLPSPPVLEVTPTNMVFTTGQSVKTFNIRNVGANVLTWDVSANTGWIALDPTSGANDATVTVTVDRSGLSHGTHHGTISVNSNGGWVDINVSVNVVTDQPDLEASPTHLDFPEGHNVGLFNITNAGGGTLLWNVSESLSWLTVSPPSGVGNGTVGVTVDRTSLSAGTYNGQILVFSNGGGALVTVTMTVPDTPPVLATTTNLVVFQSNDNSESFSIYNAGGGTLNWTITPDQPWVSVDPSSGVNSRSIHVTVDRTGLDDGEYHAVLSIVSNGGNGSVAVTMHVLENPVLHVMPPSFSFAGGETVKPMTILNLGPGTLTWSIATSVSWLSVDPAAGSGNATISVTVDRTSLAPGTYNGQIDVTSNGGDAVVPVTMIVPVPTPILGFSPSSFMFAYDVNDVVLNITNDGTAPLNWNIASDQTWLTANPASGTDDAAVSVQVDRTSLADGTYNGTLSITSNGGDGTVSVTMHVATVPVLYVTPTTLVFTPTVTVRTFSIENLGAPTLDWSLSADEPWISIDPPLSGSGDATATIRVDPGDVPQGNQTGHVTVTSNGGNVTVTVNFTDVTVGSPGVITLSDTPDGGGCEVFDNAPGLLSIYVVHVFSSGATACQFWAPMPSCMTGAVWLSDTAQFPVVIGNSQTGVAVGYGACVQSPNLVLTINYFAVGTTQNCCYYEVQPDPHVPSGQIEVVDCASNLVFAPGGGIIVNPDQSCYCAIRVEETTWGRVKSIYEGD